MSLDPWIVEVGQDILHYAAAVLCTGLCMLALVAILKVRHWFMVRLFGSDAPMSFNLGTGELLWHEGNSGPGEMRPHPDFPQDHAGRTVFGELGDPGDPVRLYLRVQLRVELPCQIAMQRASRTLHMFRNQPQGSVSRRARACLPAGGTGRISSAIDARFSTRAHPWPPARWLLAAVEGSLLALPSEVTDVIGGRDRLLIGMEKESSPEERRAVVMSLCRFAEHIEYALNGGAR